MADEPEIEVCYVLLLQFFVGSAGWMEGKQMDGREARFKAVCRKQGKISMGTEDLWRIIKSE